MISFGEMPNVRSTLEEQLDSLMKCFALVLVLFRERLQNSCRYPLCYVFNRSIHTIVSIFFLPDSP